ncbi:MAG: hypothetical protein R3300_02735, partial [Candidatus Promineifilaceae bacterium]|nr:hypothetical protein [Candidatus Promineifilaceae bacterium]
EYGGFELTANETVTWVEGGSNTSLDLTAESPQPAVSVEKYTNGQDADAPPGLYLNVDEAITWTYIVSNTGNVDLDNIVVTDDNGTSGDTGDDFTVCSFASLTPSETQQCSAGGTAVAGQQGNVATATAVFATDTVSDTDPSYYYGAVVAIDVEKHTNGQDADAAPGVYVAVGDPVTWTYTVTNGSNVDLSNVVIVDDHGTPGDTNDDVVVCSPGTLTPAQTVSCEAPPELMETADEGQYVNVATAIGTPPGGLASATDSDPSHYFGAQASVSLLKATNGQDAATPPGPFILVGDPVNWTYTVNNSGNVSLDSLQVSDSQGVDVDCAGVTQLLPNEEVICTASGTATKGQYTNTGQVAATPPGGLDDIQASDISHYFGAETTIRLEKYTNGQDADSPPGPYVPEGQPITYTYVITNTGNVTLTNISVTDEPEPPSGINCPGTILAPGEQMTCEAPDNPWAQGQQANTGTVGATPSGGLPDISDSDSSHYFGAGPGVQIEKATNGLDADSGTGPFIPVGDSVTWTYVVSNTGNVTLTQITVTDDNGTPANTADDFVVDCPAGVVLGEGEALVCEAIGTAEAGPYANLATVEAQPEGELAPISDSDPSHYFGADPSVDVQKLTNGEDADQAPGPYIVQGQPVTWTYVVSNTGNITLTNILVSDDQGVSVSCPADFALAPGAGDTCLATAAGGAVAGQYSNVGTVTADPVGGLAPVQAQDASHYFGAEPLLGLELATNGVDADMAPGVYVSVGDSVNWSYAVSNLGNVTLTDVILIDDNGTPGDTGDDYECQIGTLASGATDSTTCSRSGTAAAGQYANLAEVTATFEASDGAVGLAANDPSHYYGALTSIDVEKATNGQDADDAPGPLLLAGQPVSWTLVVTNTSNVTLTGVTVVDDFGTVDDGGDDVSCNLGDLAPGAAAQCQHSVAQAQADQYGNVAVATGTPPGGLAAVEDTDASHYYGATPTVAFNKWTNGVDADQAPGPYVLVGEGITWTYAVTNTGNITLTGVTVTDDQVDAESLICDGDQILGIDESLTCQASGSATAGQYSNLGQVTAIFSASAGPVEVSASDPSHYFGADPQVELEKLTNGQDADSGTGPYILVGDLVSWTYIITNSGNVPLTNIVVTDDNGTPLQPADDMTIEVSGPVAPGAAIVRTLGDAAVLGSYRNHGTVEAAAAPLPDETTAAEASSAYFGAQPGIEIRKYTNGLAVDEPPGPIIEAGDPVTWTYVISNTGNVTLTEITVLDDNGTAEIEGDDFLVDNCDGGLDELAVGGKPVTCVVNSVAVPGQYSNVAAASGQPPGELAAVSDTASSHYFGFLAAPDIQVRKLVNGRDANQAPGLYVEVGQPLTWTYEIRNSGNVSLTNVIVVDDMGTADEGDDQVICTVEVLDFLALEVCTLEGQAVAGPFVNTAVVSGTYAVEAVTVSDLDQSHYYGAILELRVEKATNGVDADQPPGPTLSPGDPVTWTYTVTNNSNVTLTDIDLIDSDANVAPTCTGNGVLAPGEQLLCWAGGVVKVGPYANTATATAVPPAPLPGLLAQDQSHYSGYLRVYLPSLQKP